MASNASQRRILLLTVLAALMAPGTIGAGDTASPAAATPDASAILDRYVEAIGGRAAFDAIRNQVVKGRMEIGGQDLVFEITLYMEKPGRSYSVVQSPVTGTIEQGTDGVVAWEKSPNGGPKIKEGPERTQALLEAQMDKLVRWRGLYAGAEFGGEDTVEGRPCWKVVLTPDGLPPQTLCFDKESRLLARVSVTGQSPIGPLQVETYPADFRKVGGVLLPFRSTTKVLDQERVLSIASVEQNVEMPADRFALPAEIQALVEEQKSKAAAPAAGTKPSPAGDGGSRPPGAGPE